MNCLFYRQPPSVIRIAKANIYSAEMDGIDDNEFGISNIINHPEYKWNEYYNDIALIKLAEEITISNHIRPACLWQTDAFNFTHATVIGYGQIEYRK